MLVAHVCPNREKKKNRKERKFPPKLPVSTTSLTVEDVPVKEGFVEFDRGLFWNFDKALIIVQFNRM